MCIWLGCLKFGHWWKFKQYFHYQQNFTLLFICRSLNFAHTKTEARDFGVFAEMADMTEIQTHTVPYISNVHEFIHLFGFSFLFCIYIVYVAVVVVFEMLTKK